MKHLIANLLLILTTTYTLHATEAPNISELSQTQTLTIKHTTSGCFHSQTNLYIFTNKKAEIYTLETEWSEEKKELITTEKKHLGTVELNKETTTKLDALFEFYASKPEQICTQVDHITASLENNGQITKTYEFIDGSCSASNMESVITFSKIKKLIKK